MGVYISVNTLCDMGATCCNVLGDIACSVAMKQTVKLDNHEAEEETEVEAVAE
jgi:Na+/H+-dicarboxylate symporter